MKLSELVFVVTNQKGEKQEISEANLNIWKLHEDFSYNKDLPIRILVNGKEIKA